MNVLGLSYGYHDASAALIIDGELIAASSEERHTRQKHDSFYPKIAIDSCLKKANIDISDIDQFAYYEKISDKWTRVLSTAISGWPYGLREFKTTMKSWLGGKLWTESTIIENLDIKEESLQSFEHHLSHAAQAFIGSGFHDAAILTVDAVGEWETCTLYEGKWINGKPQFTKLDSHHYPHSLGLFYSAITDYLGFKPMNDECSTMALAAFGNEEYLQRMREVITINSDGKIILNYKYLSFDHYYQKPYTKKFIKDFGAPFKGKYNFSSMEHLPVTEEEQRMANIAWAAQKVYEECTLALLKELKNKSQSNNLCLAGGGALNCVANTKIMNESGFDNLYIPSEPGDGGASIGAAYLAYFKYCEQDSVTLRTPIALGFEYDESSLVSALEHIQPSKLQKYRQLTSPKTTGVKWGQQSFASNQEQGMYKKIAQHIKSGDVVGWFQGGAEFGPRALGYRSILFKADDIDIAKRVSSTIKSRAAFRPYALSFTDDQAKLSLDCGQIDQAPFMAMQLAIPVEKSCQAQLRAGLHCDGTTRPQVVTKLSNSRYYQLLKSYGELTQMEAFVNTSFNESGYPIVESPYEALLMFARTDLDALVINNTIIYKVRG
jgi:carbamoyltransferase